MPGTFLKDANAVLDYYFDWKALANGTGASNWLADGETITSHTVTAGAGLTVDSSALINGATAVRVWMSGGTAGQDYTVACRITTSAGRTDERTAQVRVRQR
jgi:hypothetical protein